MHLYIIHYTLNSHQIHTLLCVVWQAAAELLMTNLPDAVTGEASTRAASKSEIDGQAEDEEV